MTTPSSSPTIITVYTASVQDDPFHYEVITTAGSANAALVNEWEKKLQSEFSRGKSQFEQRAQEYDNSQAAVSIAQTGFETTASVAIKQHQEELDRNYPHGGLLLEHVKGLPPNSHLQEKQISSTQNHGSQHSSSIEGILREGIAKFPELDRSGRLSTHEQQVDFAKQYFESQVGPIDWSGFIPSTPDSTNANAPPSASSAPPTGGSESFGGSFAENIRKRGF